MSDANLSLKYDALTRQLERMRAMQYGYFTKFFTWLIINGVAFVLVYLSSYPAALDLLPFWVLTAGVQASFYLHFVDFARVHASAVEKRINTLLGEDILIGGRIEDAYLYPLGKPKISGVILTRPTTFFSAFTLHWLGIWGFFFLFGLWQAVQSLGSSLWPYLGLLAAWTLLNSGYLVWYFIWQRDEKRIARILGEAYKPV